MVNDTPTAAQAGMKFDITAPRGLRVKRRPKVELDELLRTNPHLQHQLDDLDPAVAYTVELVYIPMADSVLVKLWAFPHRMFNGRLLEQA